MRWFVASDSQGPSKRVIGWIIRWIGLVGLWMVLSSEIAPVDLLVGGAAAAMLASLSPLFTDSRARRPPDLEKLGGMWRAWAHVISDWPSLVRALPSPAGEFDLVDGDGGAFLGSIGGASYVVGSAAGGRLLIHRLPGDAIE